MAIIPLKTTTMAIQNNIQSNQMATYIADFGVQHFS